MKKKIIQWLIGLLISSLGFCVCVAGIEVVLCFIDMINTTGKEFIGNFICFIIFMLMFLFIPYITFHITKDGVQDKFK